MDYKNMKSFSIRQDTDTVAGVREALGEREIRENLDSISVFSLPAKIRGAQRVYSLNGNPKKVLIVLTIRKSPSK